MFELRFKYVVLSTVRQALRNEKVYS